MRARYVFRYPAATSTGCAADVTSTRRSASTGGSAAPLPSTITSCGSSAARDVHALGDVRHGDRAREATAAAAAADGRHAGHDGGLEMVGRRVSSVARELQQALDRRCDEHRLGLGRAATPHRDDDDPPGCGEAPREVPRDGGLPHALAGSDDGERRHGDPDARRRVEAEVRAFVGQPEREDAARQREPLARPEHRLVGEIEHQIGRVPLDRHLERGLERDAVVDRRLRAASRCRRRAPRRRRGRRAPRARRATTGG